MMGNSAGNPRPDYHSLFVPPVITVTDQSICIEITCYCGESFIQTGRDRHEVACDLCREIFAHFIAGRYSYDIKEFAIDLWKHLQGLASCQG
jgi:hypothetical protein